MKKLFALLLTSILFFACKTKDVHRTIPECIQEKISIIEKDGVRNPPAEVWEYEYRGKTVYFIPSYCCDAFSELYDFECKLICHPDGGIRGGGDGSCKDFFDARTDGKMLWKDGRK